MKKNNKKFRCKTESQKKAIAASYARKSKEEKEHKKKKEFPKKFPFWARIKISKGRTTLVIDEEKGIAPGIKKEADMYVHREATSVEHKGFEKIDPNPDKSKKEPMYLKSPRKLPKRMFEPHNKDLDMPQQLKDRYEKNNEKDDQKE